MCGMTDLVEFLLARIAEDEAVARAAAAVEGERWHCHFAPYEGTWIVGGARDHCGYGMDHEYDLDEPWHPHVNRFDPARVLAECEMKRRIIEEQVAADRDAGGYPGTEAGFEMGLYRALELLALLYAEHADYREDWA